MGSETTNPTKMTTTRRSKPKIYIAGPYSHPDPEENTKQAMDVWHKIVDMGGAPFCPHLSHFLHTHNYREYESWLEQDMHWLDVCDAVYRMPGESKGADLEVQRADELLVPVLMDLHAVERFIANYPRPPIGFQSYSHFTVWLAGLLNGMRRYAKSQGHSTDSRNETLKTLYKEARQSVMWAEVQEGLKQRRSLDDLNEE